MTPGDEIVWKYVNPVKKRLGRSGALAAFGGPPKLGQILPPFLQGFMNFAPEQEKQLAAAEKEWGRS